MESQLYATFNCSLGKTTLSYWDVGLNAPVYHHYTLCGDQIYSWRTLTPEEILGSHARSSLSKGSVLTEIKAGGVHEGGRRRVELQSYSILTVCVVGGWWKGQEGELEEDRVREGEIKGVSGVMDGKEGWRIKKKGFTLEKSCQMSEEHLAWPPSCL